MRRWSPRICSPRCSRPPRPTPSWSAPWPTPPASSRTRPPTSWPRRSSPTCARRWCGSGPGSLRPEGVLATTWASRDQRVWTLTLREGVRFHDGAAFDADAVVGNLEHLRRERGFPGTRRAHRPARRPDHAGPAQRGPPLDPLPAVLRHAEPAPPGGAGPRAPGRHGALPPRRAHGPGRVELDRRSTEHWAGAPRLRRLVFRRFPDEDALARALGSRRGRRLLRDRSRAAPATLRAEAGVTLDSQTGLNLIYLAVNNERAPLPGRPRAARAVPRHRPPRPRARGARRARGAGPRARCRPPCFGRDTRARELVLDRDAARRLLAAARVPEGFADHAHRLAGAASLPARPAPGGGAAPRRPGPGRRDRAICARWRPGPSTWTSPRAATSTWPSSAGRPTPSTRTTS